MLVSLVLFSVAALSVKLVVLLLACLTDLTSGQYRRLTYRREIGTIEILSVNPCKIQRMYLARFDVRYRSRVHIQA